MANVVPIIAEDLRVHGYGIADDDSLAHLDLGFKFYDLINDIHGMLGQSYRHYRRRHFAYTLPSADQGHSAKSISTRQTSVTVSSVVMSIFLAESRIRHSAKCLPSARQKTLSKEAFADPFFAVSSLPNAILGKGFAESLCCFAECVRHSANEASLVVLHTFGSFVSP
jgi:hypothetical protein